MRLAQFDYARVGEGRGRRKKRRRVFPFSSTSSLHPHYFRYSGPFSALTSLDGSADLEDSIKLLGEVVGAVVVSRKPNEVELPYLIGGNYHLYGGVMSSLTRPAIAAMARYSRASFDRASRVVPASTTGQRTVLVLVEETRSKFTSLLLSTATATCRSYAWPTVWYG